MAGDIEATFMSVGILSILVTFFLVIVAIDEPVYAEAMERPNELMEATRKNLAVLSGQIERQETPGALAGEDVEVLGPLGFIIPGFLNIASVANSFIVFIANFFGLIINGILTAGALTIALFQVLSMVPLGIGLLFGTISALAITYFLMNFLVAFIGAIKPI